MSCEAKTTNKILFWGADPLAEWRPWVGVGEHYHAAKNAVILQ
jgi:hypothetical protein